MILTSPAFVDRGIIPPKYASTLEGSAAGKGDNISPPLSWSSAPEGTKSFALSMVDPDVPIGEPGVPLPAGMLPGDLFIHWIVYNIPPSVTSLDEGISPGGTLPKGAKELKNSYGMFGPDYASLATGYIGPAPIVLEPAVGAKSHGYLFTLYALDVENLGIADTAGYVEFTEAMRGHALATVTLIAYFGVPAVPKG
jgi:hypothetical protein